MPAPPAGWYGDPTGRFPHRYWDGRVWTEHVSSGGITSVDPVDAEQTTPVPVAGSQLVTPTPGTSVVVTETRTTGSPMGWVMGVLVVLAVIVVAYALWSGDGDGDDGAPVTTEPVATTGVAPDTTAVRDTTGIPETTEGG